ncbi:tRNA (adenosine(37)-N6)-dimethylallyltransferase MiaA [Halosquirtibacter xylanolyticus]|uniref:tRNA (adenosine(37)-N6)-dimethylallyltransferase MiaA n=1 Tax=Halosquirtibacter xylanolyticus TaxID=3374599 RepID=UPI003748761B|nr:tRNA (adenosine(37)-N6)-dimethylallyltransferase MiaA [Prolixibacteraceae bacterium]
MNHSKYDMITVLGATATGKTSLATHVAAKIDAEVISADSRQVYRGMDIGTGKDLEDFTVNGQSIPYHLIDILDAGAQYNVFEYQKDFQKVYEEMQKRNVFPVLCGGSGMYIEAVLKGYKLAQVPVDDALREELSVMTLEQLVDRLSKLKRVHNNSDIQNKKRAIRAIEIEEYMVHHPELDLQFPEINSLMVGIDFTREERRNRITQRLHQRIDEGMVDEVQGLLDSGVTPEGLIYYGLEYKFITEFITGKITKDRMVDGLNVAIHQFAKRQMTWYRRMEKNGFLIHWIDGKLSLEDKTDQVLKLYQLD